MIHPENQNNSNQDDLEPSADQSAEIATDKQLNKLFAQVMDGSAEAAQQLEAMAEQHPEKKQQILEMLTDHILLDSLLREHHSHESVTGLVDMMSGEIEFPLSGNSDEVEKKASPKANTSPQPLSSNSGSSSGSGSFSIFRFARIAAVVALSITVGWMMSFISQKTPETSGTFQTVKMGNEVPSINDYPYLNEKDGIALLKRSADIVWGQAQSDTGIHPDAGAILHQSRIKFDSGLMEIDFYSGAKIILEGPADFQLHDINSATLHQGTLRAFVPSLTEGFKINQVLAGHNISDKGINRAVFGMQIDNENTNLYVYKGHLSAQNKNINAQESAVLSPDGTIQIESSQLWPFPSPQSLDRRHKQIRLSRFEKWEQKRIELKNDPRLLLSYDFEKNSEPHVIHQTPPALIIGCEYSSGRWPATRSLEFRRTCDRVRIRIPGLHDTLTMATWVRVDSLLFRYNSLMLTDTWGHGDVHWQIDANGMIIMDVKSQNRGETNLKRYRTESNTFTPDLLGQWVHLACTYDVNGVARNYINGEIVSEHKVIVKMPIRIEQAEIGNWITPRENNRQQLRHLDGRVDEFMIFSTALSAEEIKSLYEVSSPN